jgi:predicted HTH transcriptional regulator
MITKPFDQINHADIIDLLSNLVQEGRTIEYKEDLNFQDNSEKKEFLADVSSFANAGGGDIVFGVREKEMRQEKRLV